MTGATWGCRHGSHAQARVTPRDFHASGPWPAINNITSTLSFDQKPNHFCKPLPSSNLCISSAACTVPWASNRIIMSYTNFTPILLCRGLLLAWPRPGPRQGPALARVTSTVSNLSGMTDWRHFKCQPSHSLSEPAALGVQNHLDGSPPGST